MPSFRFDKTKTFKENVDDFLAEIEGEDTEMAAILRTNMDKLEQMVRAGDRNASARASFNASVIDSLEHLLNQEALEGE